MLILSPACHFIGRTEANNVGTSIITYTILGFLIKNYSIMGPKFQNPILIIKALYYCETPVTDQAASATCLSAPATATSVTWLRVEGFSHESQILNEEGWGGRASGSPIRKKLYSWQVLVAVFCGGICRH